jgi:hypothetical protein
MKTILLAITLFWTTVAAYGMTRQRPAEFWRTLTGDVVIAREFWGRWTFPVRVMRYTFGPTVFVCAVVLVWAWIFLQAIFGAVGEIKEDNSFDIQDDHEGRSGPFYNYAKARCDNGLDPGGVYDWDIYPELFSPKKERF